MKKLSFALFGGVVIGLIAAASPYLAQQPKPAAPTQARPAAPALMTLDAQQTLLKTYCQGCHSDTLKSGNMSLKELDLTHIEKNPELAEKMIRKLRVGLMPPANAKKPEAADVKSFVTVLEAQLDKLAAANPNPGTRPFQRLTRDEYAKSIKDLLGIEVDVAQFLPPDTLSDGLDNIADSQAFSASLMEGYIRAATRISREALGDPRATPTSAVYKLPRTGSQLRYVEGAPIGTRGGISVMFNFPADGEYNFRSLLHGTPTGGLFGNLNDEELEFSIDGERIALRKVDPLINEGLPTGLNINSGKVFVKAGAHRVTSAFLHKHSVLLDDDIAEIMNTLADTDIGRDREITALAHLREFEISGPFNVTGVSDTPTRRKVFSCRPASAADEIPCATKIITNLAKQAFRRPVTTEDMEGLMGFYERARRKTDFEGGIRSSLEAILASLDFVARIEQTPANVKPGQIYRISDLELASRLSYFLWNSQPDAELITLATQGGLKGPLALDKQVKRMLKDPRSEALSTKFAGQWLHLNDLDSFHPDSFYYAQYDATLGVGLKRETELFFDSIVREDRSVLDLLTASHTFVNERVAKHYGLPNVAGSEFRRVELTDDNRRGLLGKGGILALTSNGDRTSPVLRGKWVMGVLLGTPPPPPPPAVPKLDETPGVAAGKSLSVRERMEMHRANPTCNSCHQMIDPIGLALENWDPIGLWRTRDTTYAINSDGNRVHTMGLPVDSVSKLYDGTPLTGPASLRNALLKHADAFTSTLTEKLLAYAIGRRVEYFDMPLIRTINRDAAKNNNRFSSLVMGIVKSPAFQMKKAESVTTDAAAKQN